MGGIRTKKQKKKALQRRQQQLSQLQTTQGGVAQSAQITQINVTAPVPAKSSTGLFSDALTKVVSQQQTQKPAPSSLDLQSFFGFDPKLIYQDLTKTMIISVGILILLVVFSRLPF